jgi:hypothetical protein
LAVNENRCPLRLIGMEPNMDNDPHLDELLLRILARSAEPVVVMGPHGVTNTTHGEVLDIWHVICDAYWHLSEKVPYNEEVGALIESLDAAGLRVLRLLGE